MKKKKKTGRYTNKLHQRAVIAEKRAKLIEAAHDRTIAVRDYKIEVQDKVIERQAKIISLLVKMTGSIVLLDAEEIDNENPQAVVMRPADEKHIELIHESMFK